MKRLLLPAVCLACFLSVAAYAQRQDVNVDSHPEATGPSCEEHFSVSMDGEEVYHGEEEKTLPAGSVSRLHINSQSNAGIEVQGWEKPDILVKLCKAVAAPDAAAAKERLAAIRLQIEGGNVTVTSLPGHRCGRTSWSMSPRASLWSWRCITARSRCARSAATSTLTP